MMKKTSLCKFFYVFTAVFLCILTGACAKPDPIPAVPAVPAVPAAKADPLRLSLPPEIYAVPGIESNIYFANIFNAIVPENFAFIVRCKKGVLQNHRWCWTPGKEDAGKTIPLTLEVRDDRGVIDRAECVIKVAAPAADPTRKITLALLSASSGGSGYTQFLMETMHQTGYINYTPVGTYHRCGLPLKPGLAPSDSYGGWAWRTFLTQWKYTRDEFNGVQDQAEKEQMQLLGVSTASQRDNYRQKSPLLNVKNGKVVVDVQGWFDRINGGKVPDFIIIDLGGNDVFTAGEDQIHARMDKQILPAMTTVINELRKAAPHATIGICQSGLGSRFQDAYGANYGCLQTRYQFLRNKRIYNAAVEKFVTDRNDPEILVLPYFQNIDPVNGYPRKPLPANAREKATVDRAVNALHTTSSGAHQLADAMYCWLVNQLNRKNW